MLITDALLGEHAVFYLFLGHIEQALSALDSLSALQNRFAAFAFALKAHADLEDELLFNALEPHLSAQAGPLAAIRFEHSQIIYLFGKIDSAADLNSSRDFARQLFPIVRGHFQKEEQALFQMAARFLSEDELSALGGNGQCGEHPLSGWVRHNPCGKTCSNLIEGNELTRFPMKSFVNILPFLFLWNEGNDFQLLGILIVFIKVLMDAILLDGGLYILFISSPRQKEAWCGLGSLNLRHGLRPRTRKSFFPKRSLSCFINSLSSCIFSSSSDFCSRTAFR